MHKMKCQCVNAGLAEIAETRLPAGWVVQSWGGIDGSFCYRIQKARVPMQSEPKTGSEDHSIRAWEKKRTPHNPEIQHRTEIEEEATAMQPVQRAWCRMDGPRRGGTLSRNAFDPIESTFFSSGPEV